MTEKTELYIKGERMTEMKLMQLITGSTNQSQCSNYIQKILYLSIWNEREKSEILNKFN